MRQIKTIVANTTEDFDAAVNAALAEGWEIERRDIRQVGPDAWGLYAELGRDVITEAERRCENCKHWDAQPEDEPCRSCSENADKWEPVEA